MANTTNERTDVGTAPLDPRDLTVVHAPPAGPTLADSHPAVPVVTTTRRYAPRPVDPKGTFLLAGLAVLGLFLLSTNPLFNPDQFVVLAGAIVAVTFIAYKALPTVMADGSAATRQAVAGVLVLAFAAIGVVAWSAAAEARADADEKSCWLKVGFVEVKCR